MAANGRGSEEHDQRHLWRLPGVRTPKGTIIDVPAGSALETAIGVSNLTPLSSLAGHDLGEDCYLGHQAISN